MLLSFSGSLATKFISLNNQQYMTRTALIDLNPNENNQRLHLNPFIVSLYRFNGRCNLPDDLSSKVCVLNKIEM